MNLLGTFAPQGAAPENRATARLYGVVLLAGLKTSDGL
jgi:hypothetical protein